MAWTKINFKLYKNIVILTRVRVLVASNFNTYLGINNNADYNNSQKSYADRLKEETQVI